MDKYNLTTDEIKSNYLDILQRIKSAACSVGRNPNDIKLVVVSKEKSRKIIQNAIEAGIHIFGENYADEAVPKIRSITNTQELHWHMIGHIQSRKARLVIEYFDYVHSLDSVKLANKLNSYAQEYMKIMPVLIEFNVGGEASKFGFPAWNIEHWGELLPSVEQILKLPGLHIEGLMTVPPYFTDPEKSRSYFHTLRELQEYLQDEFPQASWRELSMGMSADFEIAIEEGATWVRIGQAILGRRE